MASMQFHIENGRTGKPERVDRIPGSILPERRGIAMALLVSLVLLILSSFPEHCKSQTLNYKVVRNGSEIGWMKLEKTCEGNYCKMFLNSDIKFRILIQLTAYVFESAYFLNGKLVYSSQYHKSNGKVNVNKQTRFTGNGYEVIEDNESAKLNIGSDVSFNLLSLYFREPVSLTKVYCDKQQCYAAIEKTTDGGYRIRFPNGNSNCFYYQNGICTKVKIEHTFYSAEIILKP